MTTLRQKLDAIVLLEREVRERSGAPACPAVVYQRNGETSEEATLRAYLEGQDISEQTIIVRFVKPNCFGRGGELSP